MTNRPCRFCQTPLRDVVADLGMTPLANSFLTEGQLGHMEPFYPLRALVCRSCFLVQLEEYETPTRIFSEYAYFSSYSSTFLSHASRYVDAVIDRLKLDETSMVLEIASNDGYLLQYFVKRGIPVLGIEPAANVARVAVEKGIPTVVEFFGSTTAETLGLESRADLVVANNVLAHVPVLNDFVAAIRAVLKPSGVVTMEFPHLSQLLAHRQFDTIYHEHFSYFSFHTVKRVLEAHDLAVFDVEEIPTHGGSLRVFAAPAGRRPTESSAPAALLEREQAEGVDRVERYLAFAEDVRAEKRAILKFFIESKEQGLSIAGYGAPAKGNTLLNYCGIGTDFMNFTVDVNPYKQGTYLPGSHIPVKGPEALAEHQPDILFILPWNIKDEIMQQVGFIRDWGGRFAVRTPDLAVFE